jgi:hypothetical protein
VWLTISYIYNNIAVVLTFAIIFILFVRFHIVLSLATVVTLFSTQYLLGEIVVQVITH